MSTIKPWQTVWLFFPVICVALGLTFTDIHPLAMALFLFGIFGMWIPIFDFICTYFNDRDDT